MKPNKKSNTFVPNVITVPRAIGGAATVILGVLFGEVAWKIALSVWDTVCEVAAQHFVEVFTPVHVMTIFVLVLMFTVFVVVFNRLWINWSKQASADLKNESEVDEHRPVATPGRHVATNKRRGAFLKKDAS